MAEKYLALCILYIQKCNSVRAQECMQNITQDKLFSMLLDNFDLLFETTYSAQNKAKGVTTFSELTVLLISIYPEMLSKVFVILIMDKKVINLHKIIKVSCYLLVACSLIK